jgi:hypothetical protein
LVCFDYAEGRPIGLPAKALESGIFS